MREHGLRALPRRKWRHTTESDHSFPVARNLLDRRFVFERVDRAWTADITYIKTEEGWTYLAALMDLCSRRVVGWSVSSQIDQNLTLEALDMALVRRQPQPGLIHHSDQGSQYAAWGYQARLDRAGIVRSMSRRGNCYDNAVMESFFSTLKRERVHRRKYWSEEEVRQDLRQYIEVFYNRTRRHSALGDVSPADYERALNT